MFHPSCSGEKGANQNISTIRAPVQTDDGWPAGKLTGAGIDSNKLQIMLDRICDGTYENIHSVLLVRGGKLVFEHYFPGYKFDYEAQDFKGTFTHFTANTIHNLASVTKSITSILFGIAVDQGYNYGADEKVFKFFPQYASLNDSMKSQITLEHLLTMTSGLQWNEHDVSYSELKNDIIQLFLVPDPVRFILSKPVIHQPGTMFNYNGGNTNLLGYGIRLGRPEIETAGYGKNRLPDVEPWHLAIETDCVIQMGVSIGHAIRSIQR